MSNIKRLSKLYLILKELGLEVNEENIKDVNFRKSVQYTVFLLKELKLVKLPEYNHSWYLGF